MRVRPVTIQAGTTVTIPGGVLFTMIDCTDPVDIVFLKGGSSIDADAIQVGAGYLMEDQEFSEATITSATSQTITYGLSKSGKGRYGVSSVSVVGVVSVADDPCDNADHSDISVTTSSGQLAANANRRRALIYSLKSNAVDVLVGASGNRIEIEPGQSFTWNNTAALDFRTASGTATLVVIEEY